MINKDILQEYLHEALKANDTTRKTTIRLLISSIKLAEISKGQPLTDQEVLAAIQKEIKTKRDTIADAQKADRDDLIISAEAEIQVLEGFLPQQLSHQELMELASQVIAETGANSIKDMGNVMKLLIERLAGRASNQEASKAVRELLQ